jgi:putative ABC transport system permease protein
VTLTLERPPALELGTGTGGVPARRAVIRWAWRLFRREWRQQLLVVALVAVAVAATFVGATTAKDTQAPANFGFGTAQDQAVLQGSPSQIATEIARIERRFGTVDVIENQTFTIPGSVHTYQLRAQNPHGAFGQPMLSLLSGHYPTAPNQVAVTPGLASTLNLRIGDEWAQGGTTRLVVGTVQNPQSLLDEFALVPPGEVSTPTQVTVLFDAHGFNVSSLGPNFSSVSGVSANANNVFNPDTIVLALATIGMLLIALVAVGGFTVLAQRRLRSIGMLGAQGATDRNISLVVRANGVVVGVVGTVIGFVLGLVVWLAYRPHAEASSHHVIAPFALPWVVILPSMAIAIVATYFAATRPARAITRIPVVAALSGRPAPPREIHRSAVPGVLVLVVAFLLFTVAGSQNQGGGGMPEVVFGLVALVVAIILLAPLFLSLVGRVAGRTPVAARLALRDLARYRARSGSALSAISLGVFIAVLICVLAASRYGNVLDYAGPNLASNQLIVYSPNGPEGNSPNPVQATGAQARSWTGSADNIAAGLDTHDVVTLLEPTNASLNHTGTGRQWNGQIYVGTPQLLRAFGIRQSQIDPHALVLTMRPGLNTISDMQLDYSGGGPGKNFTCGPGQGPCGGQGPQGGGQNSNTCPRGSCVANPTIQEVNALPSGTSAPNTVLSEHAIHSLGLQTILTGWLIQTTHPLSAAQITQARQIAAQAGMSIETKNDLPSSWEVINWATVFGVVLALGILAMTVGLIRAETAADLRTLGATGASSYTRRWLTAVTAGALGLLGAVIGTAMAYVAAIGYLNNNQNDQLSSLGDMPIRNLLIVLVGMPLVALVGGWLFSGREPTAMAHQPIE